MYPNHWSTLSLTSSCSSILQLTGWLCCTKSMLYFYPQQSLTLHLVCFLPSATLASQPNFCDQHSYSRSASPSLRQSEGFLNAYGLNKKRAGKQDENQGKGTARAIAEVPINIPYGTHYTFEQTLPSFTQLNFLFAWLINSSSNFNVGFRPSVAF